MTQSTTIQRYGSKLMRIIPILFSVPLSLVFLIFLLLFIYEPQPDDGYGFSSKGNHITLDNGYKLSYIESGDREGIPLFYFHGGPGSRLEGLLYENYNRKLGIRMISIDRPGYGRSDYQQDRIYTDMANDIGQLADHLNIDKFIIMGWSSGGPYAAVCAHELPERVAGAIIVAGEGPYDHVDFPYDK